MKEQEMQIEKKKKTRNPNAKTTACLRWTAEKKIDLHKKKKIDDRKKESRFALFFHDRKKSTVNLCHKI